MAFSNHYRTLEVSPSATQTEIKQAYRRLAKLFHPDSNQTATSHDKIASVNAAYEVLGDPKSRQAYDQQLQTRSRLEKAGFAVDEPGTRAERTAAAQAHYRKQRKAAQKSDEDTEQWLKKVYTPVSRLLYQIIKPLKEQLDDLSADPFDDDLMQEFQAYLEDCQDLLDRADATFKSLPNPSSVAGVAAHLYYCLNQVNDGLEQLEMFTLNYDDYYLHTGQELFRIAAGLRREAQAAAKAIA
jgi:molecular chaperone DnaJ